MHSRIVTKAIDFAADGGEGAREAREEAEGDGADPGGGRGRRLRLGRDREAVPGGISPPFASSSRPRARVWREGADGGDGLRLGEMPKFPFLLSALHDTEREIHFT